MTNIVELELNKVTKRLADHGLALELSQDAKDFLIEKGTSADFGARPLRRAIEQYVEDPLSEDILRGHYKGKSKIVITRAKDDADAPLDHLFFSPQAAPEAAKKQEAVATADAT